MLTICSQVSMGNTVGTGASLILCHYTSGRSIQMLLLLMEEPIRKILAKHKPTLWRGIVQCIRPIFHTSPVKRIRGTNNWPAGHRLSPHLTTILIHPSDFAIKMQKPFECERHFNINTSGPAINLSIQCKESKYSQICPVAWKGQNSLGEVQQHNTFGNTHGHQRDSWCPVYSC